MIKLLTVAGPTASGKSTLGIKLAQHYNGEIISADSMQIYKGLNIGTAKLLPLKMGGIRHHLIDIIEPDQPFSAEQFKTMATEAAQQIAVRGKLPVVVGGTGLYIHSLLYELDFCKTEGDPQLRARLYDYYNINGAQKLHDMLQSLDEQAAREIHPNNVKRVIRAIEINKLTGMRKSEQSGGWNRINSSFDALIIGLYANDRQLLYQRINARVDEMIKEGLEEEVRLLIEQTNPTAQSLQAIGYKEFIRYFKGELTKEEAVELIKQETRRYAKRQMTWFKRDENIQWLQIDHKSPEDLFTEAKNIIDKRGFINDRK